jgi:hypothetical protein
VPRLNAAGDYDSFCQAELAHFRPEQRAAATEQMQRAESAWRKTYDAVVLVSGMLLDSLDLLAAGQLTTEAMRRFNAYQEHAQPLAAKLGQADWAYGGALALSISERVIPGAPTVARLLAREGGEPIAELWEVITTGTLTRLKRCPQCARWFVDESKNRAATRCSTQCTNKWWSRDRRQAATPRRRRSR